MRVRSLAQTLSIALMATCLTAVGLAPSLVSTAQARDISTRAHQAGSVGASRTLRRSNARGVGKPPAKANRGKRRKNDSRKVTSATIKTRVPTTGQSTGTQSGNGTTTAPVAVTPEAPSNPIITTPTEPETLPVEDGAGAPEEPQQPSPVETPPTETSGAAPPIFSGSQISDFWLNQSAPGAVTEVADPAGGPEKALKMTVSNNDVAPITPTDAPRAQLLSPDTIEPGDEFWWSGKFYLPVEGFPASVPGWLNIIEGAYGAPWNGTPPFEIEVVGKTLRWMRNETYNWDIPWEMPLERGHWITYLVHEKLSTSGFIELWINGEPITFFAKTASNPNHEPQRTKLPMKTLDASNNGGPNFVVIQNYRQLNMFSSVTLYQGAMKLGATRASVE